MGDRISGTLICPYCKKETDFYYAESCGLTTDKCQHCGKWFKIEQKFMGVKTKQIRSDYKFNKQYKGRLVRCHCGRGEIEVPEGYNGEVHCDYVCHKRICK